MSGIITETDLIEALKAALVRRKEGITRSDIEQELSIPARVALKLINQVIAEGLAEGCMVWSEDYAGRPCKKPGIKPVGQVIGN